MPPPSEQIFLLLVLAIPVATIAWTITHEEIFREPREWCKNKSENCRTFTERKFFYLFTCEYCFSHYVAVLILFFTHFRLLYDDWRGYAVSLFSLVWIANFYMGLFGRLRLDIKRERVEIAKVEIEDPTESSIAPKAPKDAVTK